MWSIADITRDRELQEDVFQELRHAIEYLDHAPCGISLCQPVRRSCLCRSTLANWLDHDLAEVGSGGLKLADIVSGDGASLLTSIIAAPGEVRHRGLRYRSTDAQWQDYAGAPVSQVGIRRRRCAWPSRTLVISRARDERVDPQRAAEVRFMRFFDNTPMAIATVDKSGAVGRANARFAKLAQSLSSDGAVAKSISAVKNAIVVN